MNQKLLTLSILCIAAVLVQPAAADSALGNYLCVTGPTVVTRGAAGGDRAGKVARRIEATDERTIEVSVTGLASSEELKSLRGLKPDDFLDAIKSNHFGTVVVGKKRHPVQLAFATPAVKGTRLHLLAGRPWGWQGAHAKAKAGRVSYMTFVLPDSGAVGKGALRTLAGVSLEKDGAVKMLGGSRVTTPLKRVRRN